MISEVWTSVNERLNRTISEIERSRSVSVQPSVRSFIQDLVLESLLLRGGEWKKTASANPDSRDDVQRIADQVEQVVKAIIGEASIDSTADGQKLVLLIGAVEQTHRQFCKIFPFCR